MNNLVEFQVVSPREPWAVIASDQSGKLWYGLPDVHEGVMQIVWSPIQQKWD